MCDFREIGVHIMLLFCVQPRTKQIFPYLVQITENHNDQTNYKCCTNNKTDLRLYVLSSIARFTIFIKTSHKAPKVGPSLVVSTPGPVEFSQNSSIVCVSVENLLILLLSVLQFFITSYLIYRRCFKCQEYFYFVDK